jgi:phosphatidylglycerophosphate synthase
MLRTMSVSFWPNLITGLRLAMMPVVVALAMLGERKAFVILVAAALLTDVLDGFLARKLNAYSDFGRKLDSIADYVMMLAGLTGIALLWPEIVRRELPWIATGLGAFAAVLVFGFVRLHRPPFYHTWGAKLGAAACALSLVPLLAEWTAMPFHIAIALQVLAALEEIVIAMLFPSVVGEVPSVWHAWKRSRG